METRKRLAVSGIVVLALLAILALAVGIALAQEPDSDELSFEAAAVSGAVPIQGRLTDDSGHPLDGGYSIRARIYDASTGGTTLCDDTDSITVDNGLFTMYLDGSNGCTASDLDGKQLYLGITVGSDPEMTPRQGIYPVPYAWSLRPGAEISGTTSSAIVHIENWNASGRGLRVYAMSETGTNFGIVGASRSPDGYGGYFYNNESGVGVYGSSTNGDGMQSNTDRSDHNYGLYTADNIYSLNYHSAGAIMQVVQNAGTEALELGDVAAFSGISAPLEADGPPVIQVVSANAANSTAIAGVVYSRYNIEALSADPENGVDDITPDGAAAPGEYLLVVVQGPAQVKASALAGSLQPGDLLSSAAQAGYAAKAAQVSLDGVETAMPGTVLGKVLEPLAEGEALVYIFVTLQ